MTVFKTARSPYYHMKFMFEGKQIFRSCKTANETTAKQIAEAERDRLVIEAWERKHRRTQRPGPCSTFREFVRFPFEKSPDDRGGEWWSEHAIGHYANRAPATLRCYQDRLRQLLAFPGIADTPLDEITSKNINGYRTRRLESGVSPTTVNRDLTVLQVVLNRALSWKLIAELPEFEKDKEPLVGACLTPEQEAIYMAAVNEDHQDFALILIETAVMPKAAAALRWDDMEFEEIDGVWYGHLLDRNQKTSARKRILGMTPPLTARLLARKEEQDPKSPYVFPSDQKGFKHPTPYSTFQSTHKRLWIETPTKAPLAIPRFRLYDLRHTALTRARESGATDIDLMQIAGWTSTKMANRYIHNTSVSRRKNAERHHRHMEEQRGRVDQERAAAIAASRKKHVVREKEEQEAI